MKQILKKFRMSAILLLAVLALITISVFTPFLSMLAFPLAFALGKNRDSMNVKGGGLLKSAVIASGGILATMDDLGYLAGTDLVIDAKEVEFDDERGFKINVLSGGEEWRIKSTLMQTSIDEYNLIKNGINEYRHFYYQVKLANGRYQEIYIPLGKIVSNVSLSFKPGEKRNLPIEIIALMPKGAVSVTPSGLNVAADSYGTVLEGASAVGQVTTSSGTIYSAAV